MRVEKLFPSPGSRSIARELAGGVTTFAALSYIVFVQPSVLSQAGMDFHAVLVATCVSAAGATILMGLAANYPVALAPGMGENFFFVYTLCAARPLGFGLTWQQALAAPFLAGILYMLLSATGTLGRLVNAIPESLKNGIATGIGLFITLIGFEYGNLVRLHPATLVQLGDLRHPVTLLTLAGLLLTVILIAWRVPGAILLGILGSTVMALALRMVAYRGMFSTHLDVSRTFLKLDLGGLLSHPPATLAAAVFTLFLLALFDSIGTLVAVGQQAGLSRGGELPRAGRALFSSAAGTAVGACLGTSTVVCYVESAAGVSEGARTGLANMVTGFLLLAAMFFSPLASLVGGGIEVGRDAFQNPILRYPILAPALIVVGSMMLQVVRRLDWDDPTEYIPAFLTAVTIPFAFSISAGIATGLASYASIKVLTGRWRECHWMIYFFAALFAVQYAFLS
jgi:adenine/guanine/hypoxanthine permease